MNKTAEAAHTKTSTPRHSRAAAHGTPSAKHTPLHKKTAPRLRITNTPQSVRYPLAFIVCALAAASSLYGHISPICAAVIGSFSGITPAFGFLGGLCGIIMRNDMTVSFPALISYAIIAAVRIFFFDPSDADPKTARKIAFASCMLTGICSAVTAGITARNPEEFILAIPFGVIAFVSSYALISLYPFITGERLRVTFSASHAACVCVVYMVAVCSLFGFSVTYISSAAVVLICLAALTAGRKYGAGTAAVVAGAGVFGISVAAAGGNIAGAAYAAAGSVIPFSAAAAAFAVSRTRRSGEFADSWSSLFKRNSAVHRKTGKRGKNSGGGAVSAAGTENANITADISGITVGDRNDNISSDKTLSRAAVPPSDTVPESVRSLSGKITQAAVMLIVNCIGLSALTGIGSTVTGFASVGIMDFTDGAVIVTGSLLTACGLYVLFPFEQLTARLAGATPDRRTGADLIEIFSRRLHKTGDVLGEIKTVIEKTGKMLDRANARDLSWVYNSAGDMVCGKCRKNAECWGSEYNTTVDSFNKLSRDLRRGIRLTADDLPNNIAARCPRKQQLAYALNDRFAEYVSVNAANRKLAEVREIVAAQLSATEELLNGMAEEFGGEYTNDRAAAAKVERVLGGFGIMDAKAAVYIRDGRLSVEAYGQGRLNCTDEQLCDAISLTLGREFDLPDITNSRSKNSGSDNNGGYADNSFTMDIYEAAMFGIEYGAHQIGKNREKSCGDYYDSFVDRNGNAYIVLSDGMGSGARARVDSAFACGMLVKLLRANVGLPAAVNMINTSMLVKSSDESFATLDICKINLYTGETVLFKAGGAPTYIKCNSKIIKSEDKGLPVGVSNKVAYGLRKFRADVGDIIVMTTDGAEVNEKWLEHELINKGSRNVKEIAVNVAEIARRTAGVREWDDDVSVIAVKLIH